MNTKSKFKVILVAALTMISFNANAWIETQEQVDHIANMPSLEVKQMSDEDLTENLHQINAYYLDVLNKKYKLQNTFKALDALQKDITLIKLEMKSRGLEK